VAPPIETLTSYVPRILASRLAADPVMPATPTTDHFPAAVFFADISGFTALADRLAEHGPAGVEELTGHLNTYFGQLVDLIVAHGGDVLKFAGDAPLALWPATAEPLAVAVQRAAQCGLAAQATLHAYEVAAGVRLSLRIGIAAGDVQILLVGGVEGRWEVLVAGDPMTAVGEAEHAAQPGQVVLTPAAWATVVATCAGRPLDNGYVQLERVCAPPAPQAAPPPALPDDAAAGLRAYIPDVVLARLDAGQTGWLAELRLVSVMFLNLIGLDFAAPGALAQTQAAFQTIEEALTYYGGTIRQFLVDDKGTVLIAAFGLPPHTQEDDAARAVQAAQLMQANLRQHGLRCAIGITSGRVFCGPIGNALRREYTLIGAVVNLAARLMQAAPDTILCDAATYQAAQHRLDFAAPPPIPVKGRAEPVPVYRPQGQARLVLRAQAMVGRMRERARLTTRVQDLAAGLGGIVLIEGDAGIGKSRLIDEMRGQAEALGLPALLGAGDAVEKAASYHAWRAVFSQLLHLDAVADPAARRAQVLAALGTDARLLRLAPLLNDVLPLDLPDNALTSPMSGEVRGGNIRDLLLRLVQARARQMPLLLIIEDAQWLDSASWALTQAVSTRLQEDGWPVLLVLATRPPPDPAPPAYLDLQQAPGVEWIPLDALPPSDTLALVCQRLGVAALPEPVTMLILDRAEGNPFFSEELAYALRDTGVIQIADGACTLAPGVGDLDAQAVPDTIQGVITSRIDRLPPSQQLTLKVASVIGRLFAYDTLEAIHPIEAARRHLPADLATLERLDLTPLSSPEPDLTYIFKHVITQEVTYNLMLFAQRRELHRAVAEWYERAYADDIAPFYPLLVHHWSKAEVTAKTLNYLEKAAEQALRSYANQEALDFLNEALRLDQAGPAAHVDRLRRARWERRLGEAYYCLGRTGVARTHFERALRLLGWPLPSRLAGAAPPEEPPAASHAPPAPGPADPRAAAARSEAARAYERLAQIHYLDHELRPSLYAAVRTRNLVEAEGPSPGLARGLATGCLAAALVGRRDLADSYGRRALLMAGEQEQLSSLAYVSELTGVAAAGLGQWTTARQRLHRAAEIADQLGDRRRWEESVAHLAHVDYFQGHFALSAKLRADLAAAATRRGVVEGQVWGLVGRLPIGLILDQLDRKALARVETLLAAPLGRADRLAAYGALALARLRQEAFPAARHTADTALALLAAHPPLSYHSLHALAGIAEVYLTLCDEGYYGTAAERTHLLARARPAVGALHSFARIFPIGAPQAWLRQGQYDWLAEQPGLARAAWARSLAAARPLAMPYEQGLAHYEIGRHAAGLDRLQHLMQAADLFTSLGAAYDLARTQLALEA
jgi:class 3 adenylate cyclase/tetratricopeptide (TPR) repeat protein